MAVFISCLAARARAEDWPEFRGPTGQGLVAKDELPTTWGKDKNIAWKQAIPGNSLRLDYHCLRFGVGVTCIRGGHIVERIAGS